MSIWIQIAVSVVIHTSHQAVVADLEGLAARAPRMRWVDVWVRVPPTDELVTFSPNPYKREEMVYMGLEGSPSHRVEGETAEGRIE